MACVAIAPILFLVWIAQPIVAAFNPSERPDWLFRAFFGWSWLMFPYGPVRPRMSTGVATVLAVVQWALVIACVDVMSRGGTWRSRLLWAVSSVVGAGLLILLGLQVAGYTFWFARPVG